MEKCIPIEITRVAHQQQIYDDMKIYNIFVQDCPPYVKKEPCHFVREPPVSRYKKEKHIDWPLHPSDSKGHIRGAIVLIKSSDQKYLLLKNNQLWGCPKGARHYHEFNVLKKQVHEAALKGHEIPKFSEEICFQNEETAEQNVMREATEETGLLLNPQNLQVLPYNTHSYVRFTYNYEKPATEYQPDNSVIDHENDELKWFTAEEIQTMLSLHVKENYIFNYVSFLFLRDHFQHREQDAD